MAPVPAQTPALVVAPPEAGRAGGGRTDSLDLFADTK
jgi:hypothetical protein